MDRAMNSGFGPRYGTELNPETGIHRVVRLYMPPAMREDYTPIPTHTLAPSTPTQPNPPFQAAAIQLRREHNARRPVNKAPHPTGAMNGMARIPWAKRTDKERQNELRRQRRAQHRQPQRATYTIQGYYRNIKSVESLKRPTTDFEHRVQRLEALRAATPL